MPPRGSAWADALAAKEGFDVSWRMSCLSPRFVLGTVQLGLPYGAANITGLPDAATAIALLRAAFDAGVRAFDTARAYGLAEDRLGTALGERDDVEIVTKLDPLAHLSPDAAPRDAVAAAQASLEASRTALRRDLLQVLLLHRAAHRTAWGGAIWDLLRDVQSRGIVARLGISAQSPEELTAALDDSAVAHVQLPFNMLDHRWREAGLPARLRARPDVTVHVRSIFLQGLLAAPATAHWPRVAGFAPETLRAQLEGTARRCGREAPADLALAFVRAQDWIDGVVIGLETQAQLKHDLALYARPPLASEACVMIERLQHVPEPLLDPSQWPPK